MAWACGAWPWGVALLAAVLALVVACYWPLRLEVSLRARGAPDGGWALAGGGALSVFSVAFVWSRGVPVQLTCLVFGRKLKLEPRWVSRASRPVPKRARAAVRGAWARIDPVDLALQLLDERRHIRLRHLIIDAAYGFRDPILTGRFVAALSLLSAVLPPKIQLYQAPRWDFEDGWEVTVDGRAVIRPWLMLLDVAAYVLRHMKARASTAPVALSSEAPAGHGKP